MDVYLATVFGLALAWAEDYACLLGDGVAKPQGIVNSPAAAAVTGQAGNQIQYADVAGMLAKLQPSSYDRAFWVHSPTAVPQLLQLKDGTSRAVIFGAGQEPDVRPRRRNWSLLGFPMFCSEKLPPLASSAVWLMLLSIYATVIGRSPSILRNCCGRWRGVIRNGVGTDGAGDISSRLNAGAAVTPRLRRARHP